MSDSRTSPRTLLLALSAPLALAGSPLLCRAALTGTSIDPASFAALHLASGALILVLILRARHVPPTAGGSWPMAILLSFSAVCFSFAYRDLTAAAGALLLFSAAWLTRTGYGLWRGEHLRGAKLAGTVAAVAGLAGLSLPELDEPPRAALLMLLAGAAWGAYSLLERDTDDPVASLGGNLLRSVPFAALLVLAHVAASGADVGSDRADLEGALYAVLSGAAASGLGHVLWQAARPALGATAAAASQLGVPAIAVIGGAVLLAEPITLRLLLASMAILGGIALTIRRKE